MYDSDNTVEPILIDSLKKPFTVKGSADTQITIGMEEEQEYKVLLDGENAGFDTTNLGGKMNLSIDLSSGKSVAVEVKKC